MRITFIIKIIVQTMFDQLKTNTALQMKDAEVEFKNNLNYDSYDGMLKNHENHLHHRNQSSDGAGSIKN